MSVVSDIALLIGELIVANRPTLHWGIDKDPINRADGMATYNRWLLLGEWLPDQWLPDPENIKTVDVEGVLNRLFIATDDQNENLLNTWQIMIRVCLDGGHEGAALVRPG